jgi:hypothetical protein
LDAVLAAACRGLNGDSGAEGVQNVSGNGVEVVGAALPGVQAAATAVTQEQLAMCAVKAWRRTWTTLNPPPSMASKGAGKTAVVQAAVVEVVVAAWEVYHAVVWVGSQRTKGTPHTHTDTRTHTIHTDSSIFTIPTTHRNLHWKSFPKPQLEGGIISGITR